MNNTKIWPPDSGTSDTWDVIGDLRFDDSYSNHDLGGAVGAQAEAEGLEFEEDHERSCSYFYADDEATARAIADLADRLTLTTTVTITFPERG